MTTELYFPNCQNPLVKLHTPFSKKLTIFVVQMISLPENKLSVDFLDAYSAALDYIDNIYNNLEDSRKNIGGCLITTSTGKFFSNGVDLENSIGNSTFEKMLPLFLARLLSFRLPTIAAVNGHAFGGGSVLALAHDYVIMGNQRGYICMNEILLGVSINSCFFETLRTRFSSPLVLNKFVLQAHRFTGDQALKAGFIDQAVPNNKVLKSAYKLAKSLSPLVLNRGITYGLTKTEKNKTAITSLLEKKAWMGSTHSKL
ncbi:hypothetical protein BB558_003585 [Smittium angustum]|uniref:Enoyl-CoA hydratase n=1 Tax=Smittium angustum TaxID=133377 RepID=A0A2U1J5X6_SMIAN|nr:hypothetical protein BB558_003585 [Smittium angustum]